MDKEYWINNLNKFNDWLIGRGKDRKISLIIIGGAALLFKGIIDRPTIDINAFIKEGNDILNLEDIGLASAGEIYEINSEASFFELEELLKYDNKLEKWDAEFSNIDIYLPSIEFIIFTKLWSSSTREKDWNDLLSIINKKIIFDQKKILTLIDKCIDMHWHNENNKVKKQTRELMNQFNKFIEYAAVEK